MNKQDTHDLESEQMPDKKAEKNQPEQTDENVEIDNSNQADSTLRFDENNVISPDNIEIANLEDQIADLQKQLAVAKDTSLRAHAEVDNIRRRSSKEKVNIRRFALEGFATELLAVKDSLDLAAKVEIDKENDAIIENMQQGLELTIKQLNNVFEKFSIQIINPEKGEKINPQLHQAMSIQESDEVDNNCIINVIQKGYKLHERLLRPAMVIIAREKSV